MANFGNMRESTNFEDKSGAPWYDPNKMLANVIIEMKRIIGDKKQAELDAKAAQERANPMPVQTPQDIQANYNAQVERDPNGRGWVVKKPGQPFEEFIPDLVDPKTIQGVLKQAGVTK